MKTAIMSALIALSTLVGVASSASAYSNGNSDFRINWSTGQGA